MGTIPSPQWGRPRGNNPQRVPLVTLLRSAGFLVRGHILYIYMYIIMYIFVYFVFSILNITYTLLYHIFDCGGLDGGGAFLPVPGPWATTRHVWTGMD